MSDPQVEQRAKELLRPHALRVGNREMYSSVDYVDAVAVVSDLLTKLDEAKDEKRRTDKFLRMERVAARKNLGHAEAAEARERVLIARLEPVN